MRFGEFFKAKRESLGLSIRQFCERSGYDSGNISKIERGILTPPQSDKKLHEYARALGLKKNSRDFVTFVALATSEVSAVQFRGIFENVVDEKARERLPALFEKLNHPSLTAEKLEQLINLARF